MIVLGSLIQRLGEFAPDTGTIPPGTEPPPNMDLVWIIIGSILGAILLGFTIYFVTKSMIDRHRTRKAIKMVESGEIKRDEIRKELDSEIESGANIVSESKEENEQQKEQDKEEKEESENEKTNNE